MNGHIASYAQAPYFSRLLIGLEICIGVFLLQKAWLKKLFIPTAIAMLVAFCIYLGYLMLSGGGTDNCGCFGQIIPMSNPAAFIKNIILIALLSFAYYTIEADVQGKLLFILVVPVLVYTILFTALPVRKYVVPTNYPNISFDGDTVVVKQDTVRVAKKGAEVLQTAVIKKDSIKAKPVLKKVASVYTAFTQFTIHGAAVAVDLNAGEKIVAVLSLDCDHCQAAAKQLAELSRKGRLPKVYALFLGEKSEVQPFFDKCGSEFPYIVLSPEQFFPLLTKNPPRITFLDNGNVIGDWMGEEFTVERLKEAILKDK